MRFGTGSQGIALTILCLGTVLTFLVRLIWTGPYLILGDDTGSYLSSLNFIQGTDLTGHGGIRPPLVGYFLYPFVEILGVFPGAKVAALVASVIGAGAFFLVAKRLTQPLWAAIGSVAFIWLPIYAETLGWGFLSILVIALALISMWAWLRYADSPGLDRALTAGAIMAVMAYLNQTAVPVVAVVFGVFLLYLVIRDPGTHLKYLLPAGSLVLVLGLGSIPYSLAHFTNETVLATHGEFAHFSIKIKDPITAGIAIIGSALFIYTGRKIGGAAGAFIMIGGVITSVTQSITVPSSLGLITVLGRTILWTWMFVFLALVWATPRVLNNLFERLSTSQRQVFAGSAATLVLLFLSVSWTLRLESVMPFYTTLTPDSVTALEWIHNNTGPEEKIGVYPLTLAFYTNGIANRPTITTAPVDGGTGEMAYEEAIRGWWARDDQAVRCSLGYLDNCATYLPDLGARYLLTRAEADLPLAYQVGQMKIYDLVGQP